ncbi:MAG: C-GCAxxG-C-C family protein [Acidaminococcaceae bacterium]|nr:C-GCAxxG-C-C family protein [Acidaminococcaceae bacterium]
MSELSERLGMEAGNCFKAGNNCSEAIVQAFRTVGGVDIDDNAYRLCSGFGGGMGHARDVCGALVGCTMVISTLVGRNKPEDKPLAEIYPISKEFHDRFVAEFGSSACKDLMPFEFNTKDHLRNCLKLVNRIGKFLAEFLEEKGLLK